MGRSIYLAALEQKLLNTGTFRLLKPVHIGPIIIIIIIIIISLLNFRSAVTQLLLSSRRVGPVQGPTVPPSFLLHLANESKKSNG